MKEVNTVGVVGFGVMGAAIGLNAATAGYKVVFKELNDELVKAMYEKNVLKSLKKRVEGGKMTQEQMDEIAGRISGTSSYDGLKGCDLVIEAAVENMELKKKVFEDLSNACREDAILASNTSTFLIEKLMERVKNPARTAGLHYFFPANVNKLVEVIRQKATDDDTYNALVAFGQKNKKLPITVKDFPGFAINPVFIASYAVLCSMYDPAKANAATLDALSCEALGVKFGILWVLNGSGMGTAYHAAASMTDYLRESSVGYPLVPAQLKSQFELNQPWNLTDGPVAGDDVKGPIKERLLGAIFAISSHLIENGVVSEADLDVGIRTSLTWAKGPFEMMKELGDAEAKRLVNLAVAAGDFKLPKRFA